MKKTLGLALVGGLMALGLGQSMAQTNTNTPPPSGTTMTVSLQTLNIALTGFSGGGTNSSAANEKINNQRVINSLGISNAAKSKLQFTVNSDGSTSVFVTSGSGKNVTATDVSSFFSFPNISAGPLVKGKTGYSIATFTFGGGVDTNGVALTPLNFSVQGFTTSQSSGAFNAQVNGVGIDNGNDAVLKGTVSATAPSKSVTITLSP